MRLGGQVKPGSVKWNDATLDLPFTVTDGSRTSRALEGRAAADVPRRHGRRGRGPIPRDGVFNCTNLMVKHSNEYRPPKPGETPQAMYKTLMKGAGIVNGLVGHERAARLAFRSSCWGS